MDWWLPEGKGDGEWTKRVMGMKCRVMDGD